MPEKVNAAIYRATEVPELIAKIAAMRDHGAAMATYRAELRKYNKRRNGRPEVQIKRTQSAFGITFGSETYTGFQVEHMGQTLSFKRPSKPSPRVWERFSFGGPTKDYGLFANGGKYNRPVNVNRVNEYAAIMKANQWRDLLSDPIAITSDGEVINGQHRLAAFAKFDWVEDDEKDDYNPRFLVLFDVDPGEILLADRSKRTGKDIEVIAGKTVSNGKAG